MATLTRKLNLIALGAVLGLLSFLTGCASSQTKLEAFTAAQGRSGFAYAQVNSTEPVKEARKACENNVGGDSLKETRDLICHRLDEIKFMNITTLSSKVAYTSSEVIPLSLDVNRGAIVKIDLSKPTHMRFVEVVAEKPTDTCGWVGSDNQLAYDPITKAGSVALGTVGGLMIWPGLAYLSTDRQGGVECNGWSYKTAYKDFLSKY